MQYLTGIHALNVKCPLETCGDWHQSALKWQCLTLGDTEQNPLGEYGIFYSKYVPDGYGGFKAMYVANTIRALFDLLLMGEAFALQAQGMREDFICNEKYTPEVFRIAISFKDTEYWDRVDKFIEREYRLDWLQYKGVL